ncbi:MMPL family transporter [Dactylosporangium sucinum]|uniref:Membrane protein n=1 Tax=Dactylosporangium sucinum TaxID=1424081 RepID=A0A917X7I4_9ACTN|nr:MMPL family transporter [Dactylosporangium sucinum]GGM83550.1 membrane protein [Dactylosporangium sucinum]
MATLLYRLGRFSFRRRRLVAVLWLALLIAFGIGAAKLSGPPSDTLSIPGTESVRAMEVIKSKMGGGSGDNATAKVVFTVSGTAKLTDPAQQAAVERAVTALAKAPQVTGVVDPFQAKAVSPDGQTAYATVAYGVKADDVDTADRDALIAAGRTGQTDGVQVEFSGAVTQQAGEGGGTELLGVVIAAIVLAITFGAMVAAGLPLLTAVLGVGIGMLGIQIATGLFDLNGSTSALATMLGLAVGIDYALFVVSRYRHELAAGRAGEDAAGRAVGTAGSAVVFAGLTVIIALSALSVVGIPFLTSMGIAAAGTVAIAVLITLSLLPALLGFAGRRILSKRQLSTAAGHARSAKTPFGERWARLVLRHRIPVLVLSLGVALLVAVPAMSLRLALPDDSTANPASTQRKAYDQLAAGFGPGFQGPLVIVVEAGAGKAQAAAARAGETIAELDDVVAVTPPNVNQAGDTAILTVIPASAPTADATKDLVAAIRDHEAQIKTDTGATVSVTGTTALNIDVSDKLVGALVPYLAVVVGLAFILLMLVFRSILVPLKATLGFLLSVAATFGALVAVFQWGWLADVFGLTGTGPIMSLMPIFLVGILFGLAMDYEVFLVTRTREEFVHGATPDDAIITGMRHGARVVTAAALIMIAVFAGFIFTDQDIIKSLGFALAFGVAIDAFLVRMTIVPAVLSLLGRSAWWLPRWLNRLLPNVDVEGEGLTRRLAAEHADQTDQRQPAHV